MANRWTELSLFILAMLIPTLCLAKTTKLDKINLDKIKLTTICYERPYEVLSKRDKDQLDKIVHRKFDPKFDPNLTLP